MVDDRILLTVSLVFFACVIVASTAWLAHAARANARQARLTRSRPAVLAAVAAALHGGDEAAALRGLTALPRDERIALLVEMAYTVTGAQRWRLDGLAARAGVLALAVRWARSRRWTRRLRATRLLTLFGGDNNAGEALMRDPDPDVRAQAAEWAGEHPSERRAARLVEMLLDPDPRCRFAARMALVRGRRASVAPLAAFLDSPPADPRRVADALEVATGLAEPRLSAAGLRLTRSRDPLVRSGATRLVAAIGGAEAAVALERLLADPAPEVRRAAAGGLGHLGRWQSAAAIAPLLAEGDWRVRRSAAGALSRMGPTGELMLRRALRGGGGGASSAHYALELAPTPREVTEPGQAPEEQAA